MAIVTAIEQQPEQLGEPRCAEKGCYLFVLTPGGIDELVLLGEDEPAALLDATAKVHVDSDIGVDVIERKTAGIVDVDGLLPCLTPSTQVVACEVLCLLLQAYDYVFDLAVGAVFFLCHDSGFNVLKGYQK